MFSHQNLPFKTNSEYHSYDIKTCNDILLNCLRLTWSLDSLTNKGIILYNKLTDEIKTFHIKKLGIFYYHMCHLKLK